jgi:hypothetical protein
MFSYQFYSFTHFLGIFLIFLSLGGVLGHVANGGDRQSNKLRKFLAINHGVGLFVLLVGGFGMLARLGMTNGLPGWVYVKLIVWFVFGAATTLVYKKPHLATRFFAGFVVLGALAAIMGVYKPL